jgi:hypothetical protein
VASLGEREGGSRDTHPRERRRTTELPVTDLHCRRRSTCRCDVHPRKDIVTGDRVLSYR